MFAVFKSIASVFIMLPVLTFPVIFIISKLFTKNRHRSVRHAIDGSTIFFIAAVYYLNKTIWGQGFLWLILLVIVLIAMIVSVVNWKVREEVDFVRIMRGTWRMQFLLFGSAYVILFVIGLVKSIVESVS